MSCLYTQKVYMVHCIWGLERLMTPVFLKIYGPGVGIDCVIQVSKK